MARITFCILFLYVIIGPVWLEGGEIPNPNDITEKAVIDSSGGSITVSDEQGYTISLSIPYGALKKSTTITMTSLGQKLDNPIRQNIFPGVRIEPEDLLLREPATLEINFDDEIPNSACVFSVLQDDLVIPIAEQTVDIDSGTISGKIYYLKQYAGGVPTEEEIITQIDRTKQQSGLNFRTSWVSPSYSSNCLFVGYRWQRMQTMGGGLLYWNEGFTETGNKAAAQGLSGNSGACYGWRGTYTIVKGLLLWAQRLMEMGNEAAAQDAMKAAEEILDQDIESFLEREVPADPCGSYARAAFKYGEAAIMLGISTDRGKAIQKRVEELMDQCTIRFSIEIEMREVKDQPENDLNEQMSSYGTVTCHVPFSNFLAGDYALIGEGFLSYKYKYKWKYQEAMNYTHTINASGTINVKIGHGYMYVKTNEAGQSELWLHAQLSYQNDAKGTDCDTGRDTNPCMDFVDDHKWNDSLDFPLKNGAQIGGEYTNADKGTYVKNMKTLYIIHLPTESDESDTECY